MDIEETITATHQAMVEKGWYEGERSIPELLCLVHSEISEALESYRDGDSLQEIRMGDPGGKPEGFPVELADAVLRIFDLAGYQGVPLVEALKLKMRYNACRPHRHGGKRC